MGGGKVLKA